MKSNIGNEGREDDDMVEVKLSFKRRHIREVKESAARRRITSKEFIHCCTMNRIHEYWIIPEEIVRMSEKEMKEYLEKDDIA